MSLLVGALDAVAVAVGAALDVGAAVTLAVAVGGAVTTLADAMGADDVPPVCAGSEAPHAHKNEIDTKRFMRSESSETARYAASDRERSPPSSVKPGRVDERDHGARVEQDRFSHVGRGPKQRASRPAGTTLLRTEPTHFRVRSMLGMGKRAG